MYCYKCCSFTCVCSDKDSFSIISSCKRCGGTGWVRFISKNDIHDPHSYDGPCPSCSGTGKS